MGAGGSAAVEIINGHLKHFLINTNPLNVEQLWDQMYTSSVFYGRRGIFAMALSSVDNALWDIAGKYADKPVYELLGGSERDRIEIYQTNGDFLEAQRRGVKNFKRTTYGGPRTPKDALDRFVTSVLEARDQLGPDVRLMTDCVSRDGTVEWAIPFCERLREANLTMEELLSPDNVFGYAELRRRSWLQRRWFDKNRLRRTRIYGTRFQGFSRSRFCGYFTTRYHMVRGNNSRAKDIGDRRRCRP